MGPRSPSSEVARPRRPAAGEPAGSPRQRICSARRRRAPLPPGDPAPSAAGAAPRAPRGRKAPRPAKLAPLHLRAEEIGTAPPRHASPGEPGKRLGRWPVGWQALGLGRRRPGAPWRRRRRPSRPRPGAKTPGTARSPAVIVPVLSKSDHVHPGPGSRPPVQLADQHPAPSGAADHPDGERRRWSAAPAPLGTAGHGPRRQPRRARPDPVLQAQLADEQQGPPSGPGPRVTYLRIWSTPARSSERGQCGTAARSPVSWDRGLPADLVAR